MFVDNECVRFVLQVEEVFQYSFSHATALFGVKLSSVEIVLVQSCRIGQDIVACGYGIVLMIGYAEAMHVVDVFMLIDALKEWGREVVNTIPSHLRNLVFMYLGNESFYIQGKDAQTVGIAFLAVAAHQLLTDADAKHWLAQVFDNLVQIVLLEVSHCVASFALTGEEDSVGLGQ